MDNSRIFTVSSLTASIKQTVEGSYPFVWVRGQVVNLSRPSSGHVYFSLKDEFASLAAVWFKGNQQKGERFDPLTGEVYEDGPKENLAGMLENGQEIICAGRLAIYPARGIYQLVVEIAQDVGIGRLQAAFEQLKEKLAQQGYFALERKRPLPVQPRHIAVITAPTGAAVHDFLRIASTRGFGASIHIHAARMQGTGAAAEITECMEDIQRQGWAQVIVLIRGGGSLEDLWEFNNEDLATAVKNSAIPVLAGIGHEVDFTLADMTADVRAATPSHAAQLLWPDRQELFDAVTRLDVRMQSLNRQFMENAEQRLDDALRHVAARSPWQRLASWQERIQNAEDRLRFALERAVRARDSQLASSAALLDRFPTTLEITEKLLASFQQKLDFAQERLLPSRVAALEALTQRLAFAEEKYLTNIEQKMQRDMLRLEAVNPLQPLQRGYSLVYSQKGELLHGIDDAVQGEVISVAMKDGTLAARVEEKYPEDMFSEDQ